MSENNLANITRRQAALLVATGSAGYLATSLMSRSGLGLMSKAKAKPKSFRLWASACSHVLGDLNPPNVPWNLGETIYPRESLATAIRQSEGTNNDGAPSFDWDLALHIGDFSISGKTPSENEGREVIRQFAALRKHRREDFYCLAGNHDASVEGEAVQWWFRKWIDPLGENTRFSGVDSARRRYSIRGTWENYEFRVGNILFLMMADRNDLPPPAGRAGDAEPGGHPPGAVTRETFDWWKERVEANQDKIIISAHHHMLRGTTVASGPWEGLGVYSEQDWRDHISRLYPNGPPADFREVHPQDRRYHGYSAKLPTTAEGSSYLYFVDDKPDAQAFESYLAQNPGAIDIWLGAHTHAHPSDKFGGRSHVETKWGVNFINVAALTAYYAIIATPKSRLLSFLPDSRNVRVQCYLHNDEVAPRGWYDKVEKTIRLRHPFQFSES